MYVLHLNLKIKDGEGLATERDFHGPFKAAISKQEGFKSVALLRPVDGGDTVLTIAFESRELQQKWVATELHQQVWSLMERHFAGYSLRAFEDV